MLSLRSRLGIPRYGPNGSSPWSILSSKAVRTVIALVLLSGLLLTFFQYRTPGPAPLVSQDQIFEATQNAANAITEGVSSLAAPRKGRLHLLIPATSSNPDLCKLLLSAHILGYPTPILLNFGDVENHEDEYVQHLAKVQGIYDYLQKIETSSEHSEDLVLIIDGYDLWFQLRPDVLIKRYYAINKAANQRAVEKYGQSVVAEKDMRQTVLFGPDKICWPVDYSRPACWAVPESNMPYFSFGPQTGNGRRELNHPIWLNSGTIMGPVQDLMDVFNATLEEIHRNHTTDSDQFYFANIFGAQEFARLQNNHELMDKRKNIKYGHEFEWPGWNISRIEPEIEPGQRTEYHIGIDYASTLFQTLAFWKQYLTWVKEEDAWVPPNGQSALYYPGLSTSPYNFALGKDIHQSLPPFYAMRDTDGNGNSGAHPSWSEVQLLYNVISSEAPALIHFTGDKPYRQFWWQRMWFQPHAEELRRASLPYASEPISTEDIEEVTWYNAEVEETDDIVNHGRGGAFDDRGGYLGWRRLCAAHEAEIYDIPDQRYFHPPPEGLDEPGNPEDRSEGKDEEEGNEDEDNKDLPSEPDEPEIP